LFILIEYATRYAVARHYLGLVDIDEQAVSAADLVLVGLEL